jgi:hypothetical protein
MNDEDRKKALENVEHVKLERIKDVGHKDDLWKVETIRLNAPAEMNLRREVAGLLAEFNEQGYEIIKITEIKQEELIEASKKANDKLGEGFCPAHREGEEEEDRRELVASMLLMSPYLMIIGRKRLI